MVIVLIGYRGSGKTTVGRLLAGRLGVAFFDCDELIVAREGKPIRQIFRTGGEEAFRKVEMQIVSELASKRDCVIALGGGAILREENRRALAGSKIVYLRCQEEELLRRIKADPASADNRPHLTSHGGEIEEIRSLLLRREPIYRSAMFAELDVTNLTPLQAAERLQAMLA